MGWFSSSSPATPAGAGAASGEAEPSSAAGGAPGENPDSPTPEAAAAAAAAASAATAAAATAAVGAMVGKAEPEGAAKKGGGWTSYVEKQLGLKSAEELRSEKAAAPEKERTEAEGEAAPDLTRFPFRPFGCCTTAYAVPTFAPLSLTNPACLVGQHVSLMTGEDYHCGSCFPLGAGAPAKVRTLPLEVLCVLLTVPKCTCARARARTHTHTEDGPCASCNRCCANRVCRMGTKGWAVCACFSWLDFLPCCSCPPVGWFFCVPHFSMSAAAATYLLRQRIIFAHDVKLDPPGAKGKVEGMGTDRMGAGAPHCCYCCLLTQQVAFLEAVTGKDARMRAREASLRERKAAADASAAAAADEEAAPQQEQMAKTSKDD